MTPGSAGGELGDYGALRRDSQLPGSQDPMSFLPSLPIPPPPICFLLLWEEFRGSQYASASLSAVIQTWKYTVGRHTSHVFVVKAYPRSWLRGKAAGLGRATLKDVFTKAAVF